MTLLAIIYSDEITFLDFNFIHLLTQYSNGLINKQKNKTNQNIRIY